MLFKNSNKSVSCFLLKKILPKEDLTDFIIWSISNEEIGTELTLENYKLNRASLKMFFFP